MSDSITTQAQTLVDTFSAISNPDIDDVNTLTFGISNLLNTPGISASDAQDVVNILTSIISTNSTLSSDFSLGSVEQPNMTPAMNVKFLTAAAVIFNDTASFNSASINAISDVITTLSSISNSVTPDQYDALWVVIEAILNRENNTALVIASAKKKYYALLTMYLNLNYSNYMSVIIDVTTVTAFYDNLMIYLETILEDDKVTSLNGPILDALTNNAADSTTGMARIEFILACKDILALLLLYTPDKVAYFQTSFERFIKIIFSNSTKYSTQMELSGAATLTSTVSTKFGVTAIPLTPQDSVKFIDYASTFFLIYPFTIDQIATIQTAMTNYFDSIEYPFGLSASQVGGTWTTFNNVVTPLIVDTSEYTAVQWLALFKTSFTNNTTLLYNTSVQKVLSAKAYFDSWGIEYIYVTNLVTDKTLQIAGDYLSDWLNDFIANITPKIGDIAASILKIGVTDIIKAGNNEVYEARLLRGWAVTGQNFLQIGIEILLFLKNFMEQSDLDDVASQFTNYFVSILYVSSYLDYFWNAINIAVMVIIAIIVIILTVITVGAAAGVFGAVGGTVVGVEAVDVTTTFFAADELEAYVPLAASQEVYDAGGMAVPASIGAMTIAGVVGLGISTLGAVAGLGGWGYYTALFIENAGLTENPYGIEMNWGDESS